MNQDSSLTRSLSLAQEQHATRDGKAFAYRLYLGHGNPALTGVSSATGISTLRYLIAETVTGFVQGATLKPAVGIWRGNVEHSTVVEIIGLRSDLPRMQNLREALRLQFEQESVGFVYFPVIADF